MDYNARYFQRDMRTGTPFYVDGEDVYDRYNADLIEFSVSQGKLKSDYWVAAGKSSFEQFGVEIEPKEAEASFYVGGPSAEEAQINVSGLQNALSRCVLIPDDTRFEYPAVLTSFSCKATGVEPYYLVTASFAVVRRLPLREVIFHSGGTLSGSFFNPGNTESGLRLEITSGEDIGSVYVAGIVIHNLEANVPFLIDGIAGTVTSGGINRFLDTNLISFPKASPGENTISIYGDVQVKASFYPVFL